ncbi:hypothetical protein E2C01_056764 [Portunus trituberculatus]|uniref:Uncharacterized protein n=1 Tax=Portunus trituberculatus TaxID=210409 RepID=A0A5B7GZ40_PORTR|nr:hypothetical protein [Portunus trituberculatus]
MTEGKYSKFHHHCCLAAFHRHHRHHRRHRRHRSKK